MNQRAEEHWMKGGPVTGDENANTSWVVEVENMLADRELSRSLVSARCEEQSIYMVPKRIKDTNSKAYQPRLVSLGPFHHGDSNLLPMEEHKRRALVQLVKRSGKPLQDFIATVEEMADKLEAAYDNDLDDRWRGKNRHRFVEVMVTDGCFLLEILMGDFQDYGPRDPFFGTKGRSYRWADIRSDMLVMENQLPLLLLHRLHRLVAVRFDILLVDEMDEVINRLVLKFIGRSFPRDVINHLPLKLHPLDLYYTSLVYGADQDRRSPLDYKYDTVPSAVKIHESGIKFRKSKTNSLNDIHFEHGVLSMPVVEVEDHTEYLFLNLMAFERLHVDVGTLVTDYVIFLDNIIDTVEDVALLSSEGVLKNFLGSDDEVTKLFNGTLSRGTVVGNSRKLHELQCDVKAYCKNGWVVEVENMLADRELPGSLESARCEEQSIYRVPKLIKDMNSKAYQPQLVSLGPFHHGDPNLLPMEEHKRRALVHLVKRSGKPLQDFIAAVEEVADKLEAAYGKDLCDRWRGENRHRFVELMVTDGCFLLEILMGDFQDYEPHDSFFGTKFSFYLWYVIRSDMLVMENQLPLLLLHRLVAVRFDIPLVDEMGKVINHLVLEFIGRSVPGDVINCLPLKLHPLDLYYTSLVYDYGADQDRRSQVLEYLLSIKAWFTTFQKKKQVLEYKYDTMPSAVKIHESGIKFRRNKTNSLNDIHFEHGVLSMPVVEVDDDTEYLFLNLMAFERLHVDVGTLVMDYVIFMDNIIDSVEDVALLRSKEVLKSFLGSNEAVATLFNGTLSRGAVVGNSTKLHDLQSNVKAYYKKPCNKWRADLKQKYYRNPWAFISLVAAAILLAATLVQTVYTVIPFKSKR